MEFEQKVNETTYRRWEGDRFSIAMYTSWKGKPGVFYMAYDKWNLSRRLQEKPVSSFGEAVGLCKVAGEA